MKLYTGTDPLADHMRKALATAIVQKAILCPRTRQPLDVDGSVFLLDSDGDPVTAVSQEAWAAIVEEGGDRLLEKTHGLVAAEDTVKA